MWQTLNHLLFWKPPQTTIKARPPSAHRRQFRRHLKFEIRCWNFRFRHFSLCSGNVAQKQLNDGLFTDKEASKIWRKNVHS